MKFVTATCPLCTAANRSEPPRTDPSARSSRRSISRVAARDDMDVTNSMSEVGKLVQLVDGASAAAHGRGSGRGAADRPDARVRAGSSLRDERRAARASPSSGSATAYGFRAGRCSSWPATAESSRSVRVGVAARPTWSVEPQLGASRRPSCASADRPTQVIDSRVQPHSLKVSRVARPSASSSAPVEQLAPAPSGAEFPCSTSRPSLESSKSVQTSARERASGGARVDAAA